MSMWGMVPKASAPHRTLWKHPARGRAETGKFALTIPLLMKAFHQMYRAYRA